MIARTLYNNQILKKYKSSDLRIVQLIIKLKSVETITEKMKGYTNKIAYISASNNHRFL